MGSFAGQRMTAIPRRRSNAIFALFPLYSKGFVRLWAMGNVHHLHADQNLPADPVDAVKALRAAGATYSVIAERLGMSRNRVAGIVFRAKGGARYPTNRPTPRRRLPMASITIHGQTVPTKAMSGYDKAQMFGAYAVLEGSIWWVSVPDEQYVWLRYRQITLRRHMTGRHFPELGITDEAKARVIAYEAHGFY